MTLTLPRVPVSIDKAHNPLEIGYPIQMKLTQKILDVYGQCETKRQLYSTWCWWFALEVTQISCFALGITQILAFLDVGIGNAKLWRWGSKPTPGPNANGFALQWNIGLILLVSVFGF